MDELLKELDYVFRTISSIPVTEDSVDKMAVARAKLRKIYASLQNLPLNTEAKEKNADGSKL